MGSHRVLFIVFFAIVCSWLVHARDIFEPTWEWQQVKPGQAIPGGLEVRINMDTGVKEARRIRNKTGFIPASERAELRLLEDQEVQNDPPARTPPAVFSPSSSSAERVARAAVQEALRSNAPSTFSGRERPPRHVRIMVEDAD